MGPPNDEISYAYTPKVSVRIRGTDGALKECSMDAMDKSATSDSYECKSITDTTNGMYLQSQSFTVEDEVYASAIFSSFLCL